MIRLRWILFYAVALFIMAVCLVSFMKEFSRVEQLSASLDERMDEYIQSSRQNQGLKEKIDYYKTPSGIAYLAREKFNLVKPGETVYKLEYISSDRLQDN